jgi:hypothetical protein
MSRIGIYSSPEGHIFTTLVGCFAYGNCVQIVRHGTSAGNPEPVCRIADAEGGNWVAQIKDGILRFYFWLWVSAIHIRGFRTGLFFVADHWPHGTREDPQPERGPVARR